eukprot:TRINITY_DN62739_c0_g1_i1.p1 TRINITY_DN62739_c0_g1~~TRINITY_DN62739_c0_g1_i1.p1  ORF type:complete len:520 (-),score=93.45 TRINITY_DN62739_c0_g1_i1:134-1693(-)
MVAAGTHTTLHASVQSTTVETRELTWDGAALGDSGQKLADALAANPEIRSIQVSRCCADSVRVVAGALGTLHAIEDVVLAGEGLSDEPACVLLAQAVGACASLRRLHLEGALGDQAGVAIATALERHTGLQVLDVMGDKSLIGNGTGVAMAQALRANASLRTLRLAGVGIGLDTGMVLAEALRGNSTLEQLLIAGCGAGAGDAFAAALVELLGVNTTLKSLAIENHRLSDADFAALAEVLRVRGPLESLQLICAGIGNETGVSIAKGLASNSTLTFLCIDGLHIDDDTLLAVAVALRSNTRLRRLVVQNPCLQLGMSSSASEALGAALAVNSTLRSLKLAFGHAGGEPLCSALAAALSRNASLTALELQGEGLDEAAVAALAQGLSTNATLKHLRLHSSLLGLPESPEEEPEPAVLLESPSVGVGPTASLRGGAVSGRSGGTFGVHGTQVLTALARNRELCEYWRLVAWIARKGASAREAVGAMTEAGFHLAVFSFFLPRGAPWPSVKKRRSDSCSERS